MAQAAAGPVRLPFLKRNGDLFMAAGVVFILLLLIVPLSAGMLDLFLVLSLAVSLTILLIGIYITRPLEFSIFPTVLLLSTIYRLALNLASSRLILLHGSQGSSAAGYVIEAFGHFVVGGNQVVGLIIFFILNVINFVVITKGAGRISEVSARFTLDAMPGKQLAIDADLNAGIINDKQAKQRREDIQREADFYGSMDGASKFVRGDAIAGILITAINIIGGLIIGVAMNGMEVKQAFEVYTVMTIGDGLVAQIPALIVSFAAGLIVTKVNKDESLQTQIAAQIFSAYRPLAVVSGILFLMLLIPGLPKLPIMAIAGLVGGVSYFIFRRIQTEQKNEALALPANSPADEAANREFQELPPALDVLEIEVGYDLVPLVNGRVGGDFVKRILALRKQFGHELGILIPPIHIQDNLQLRGNEYRILLKSVPVAKGELFPGHFLAMESGRLLRTVEGIPTKEPTYGLPALWVPESRKEDAIVAGYTVVDLGSVIATHLSETIRKAAAHILNRQDLQTLLDEFKKTYPKVVTDLIPELLPFGTVLKVLQNLLREKVPVRDLLTILECLASDAPLIKDPLILTEAVRKALGPLLANLYKNSEGQVRAVSLEKALEDKLNAALQMTHSGPELHVDPVTAQRLIERMTKKLSEHAAPDGFPVVICSQNVRPHLFQLLDKFIPSVVVVSHNEVAGYADVKIVDCVSGEAK